MKTKTDNGTIDGLIVLSTSKGTLLIPAGQIIRIQSLSNYSKLFFNDGKTLVVAKVLCWFEEQHCLCSFVRVHRSHLVNIVYIKSYKAGSLLLHNGEMIAVAKRKKACLLKRLNSLNNSFHLKPVSAVVFNNEKILAA